VPAAAVLIGRWNWWPSALGRARPAVPQEGVPQEAVPQEAVPPEDGPGAAFTAVELLLKLAPRGHGGRGGLAKPTR
jgi:hypothetical protein